MEWLVAALGAFVAFVVGFVPTFGQEVLYRMSIPSAIVRSDARIVFGGDMMFDRTIRLAMEENGADHVFSCIGDVLGGADVVVGNLEGPITSHESVSVGSAVGSANNFTFTFPLYTGELLYRQGVRIVNLGNNHIMNFSRDGLIETKTVLETAGVQYFGDPDATEEERVLRADISGVPFTFVNWSDWTPIGKPTASNGAGQRNPTVEQIRLESEAGRVVVVYTHWGEEYIEPLSRVRALAHQFVDAGAAIVIGSHPHVVQEHEVYNGKHIYYSLGNFIFDQYWNEEVSTGLLLDVSFTEHGVASVTEIPITLQRDRRTCVREGAQM